MAGRPFTRLVPSPVPTPTHARYRLTETPPTSTRLIDMSTRLEHGLNGIQSLWYRTLEAAGYPCVHLSDPEARMEARPLHCIDGPSRHGSRLPCMVIAVCDMRPRRVASWTTWRGSGAPEPRASDDPLTPLEWGARSPPGSPKKLGVYSVEGGVGLRVTWKICLWATLLYAAMLWAGWGNSREWQHSMC